MVVSTALYGWLYGCLYCCVYSCYYGCFHPIHPFLVSFPSVNIYFSSHQYLSSSVLYLSHVSASIRLLPFLHYPLYSFRHPLLHPSLLSSSETHSSSAPSPHYPLRIYSTLRPFLSHPFPSPCPLLHSTHPSLLPSSQHPEFPLPFCLCGLLSRASVLFKTRKSSNVDCASECGPAVKEAVQRTIITLN